MREIERTKKPTKTATFAVRRNCDFSTKEAYRIRRVRIPTVTISVRMNAMNTAAIRTVRRWADIMTVNTSTTKPGVRLSRVRWSRSRSQIHRGTKGEKEEVVGDGH